MGEWQCRVEVQHPKEEAQHAAFSEMMRSSLLGVQDKGGIPLGLQRLSYAGKNLEDAQRTLEQRVVLCCCSDPSCHYTN